MHIIQYIIPIPSILNLFLSQILLLLDRIIVIILVFLFLIQNSSKEINIFFSILEVTFIGVVITFSEAIKMKSVLDTLSIGTRVLPMRVARIGLYIRRFMLTLKRACDKSNSYTCTYLN